MGMDVDNNQKGDPNGSLFFVPLSCCENSLLFKTSGLGRYSDKDYEN